MDDTSGRGSVFNLEGTTLSNLALATSGLGEHILTVVAGDDGLSMAEHNIGLITASALDIHKVGIRGGDKTFKFVGLAFLLDSGVKKISVHQIIICEYK